MSFGFTLDTILILQVSLGSHIKKKQSNTTLKNHLRRQHGQNILPISLWETGSCFLLNVMHKFLSMLLPWACHFLQTLLGMCEPKNTYNQQTFGNVTHLIFRTVITGVSRVNHAKEADQHKLEQSSEKSWNHGENISQNERGRVCECWLEKVLWLVRFLGTNLQTLGAHDSICDPGEICNHVVNIVCST